MNKSLLAEFQFPNDRAQLWLLVTADHRWAKAQEIRLADMFCALGAGRWRLLRQLAQEPER